MNKKGDKNLEAHIRGVYLSSTRMQLSLNKMNVSGNCGSFGNGMNTVPESIGFRKYKGASRYIEEVDAFFFYLYPSISTAKLDLDKSLAWPKFATF